MRSPNQTNLRSSREIRTERVFPRFTLGQRWEHAVLLISFIVLLLTGLPQKYFELWGHYLLTQPETVLLFRRIHLIAATVLTLEVIYHLAHGIWLMARRRLPGDIFPTWQDVREAWEMLKYLLFQNPRPPAFGKYNFEQKLTYWFLFLGIGIMIGSGLILWFPIFWTRFFPGGIIPAARLAHSTEAVVATIFVLIWHLYHVHIERLNLSIFTGRLSEREMRKYHFREWLRLTTGAASTSPEGESHQDQGETP